MVADFPWTNSIFGSLLSLGSDQSAIPYRLFFVNMNIASTYLLGMICVFAIGSVGSIVMYCCHCRKYQIKSYCGFVYCFFVFGVVFAGCASLQGAVINPF